jgi:hypothetical protein
MKSRFGLKIGFPFCIPSVFVRAQLTLIYTQEVLTVDTDDDRLGTQFEYAFVSDEKKVADVTETCALYVAAIQLEFQ